MNYKLQRKIFNEIVFFTLLKQLKFSKSSSVYRNKIRERNLKKCIECAYKIPFYRKRFNESGITPKDIKDRRDLVKLPVLTKEEFRTWMNSEINKTENKYCMIAQTSGSTGNPLRVLNTPYEYAVDIANVLRSWMICGFNPFTSKTLTDADDTSENKGYKSFIQKLGLLRREMVDANGNIEQIITTLNDFRPNFIRMYKSQYMRIAQYVENNNIHIHKPDFFCVIGESVDEMSKKILNKVFGENLINSYGCVEAGAIATKKSDTDYYEIFDDAVCVNVYDDNGILTNKLGRLVFTTLYKNTFPLINYDIRDKGKLAENSYGTILTELYGRENDEIKYQDGTVTSWVALWSIIAKQHDILQAQFIQESIDNIILQMIVSNQTSLTREEIERKLLYDLNKEIAGRAKLQIRWVDNIPVNSKGKQRMIVNKI